MIGAELHHTMSFSTFALHTSLLSGIRELGFVQPTPIQTEAIPIAMSGRDLLACAQTGSGKTAAFLLPIMNQLIERPRRTTRALILTPTRELAAQILEDLNALAVHTPLTAAAVYGGVGMAPQEHAFRTGVDVIVATPGRLLDHFQKPYAKLAGIEFLVLDEADRMLDMGFLPAIRRVLRHIPPRRQTLFFSATMPPEIATLAGEMLKNPARIALQRQAGPPVGITHAVYPVPQGLKAALFFELLERNLVREALVFTRTKHRTDRLTAQLVARGVKAARIHGNRSQSQRTQALEGFKRGAYRVLVATDIAARGIDVEALSHVVNFDVPVVPDDYIHRVGRTGRASATGDAFTFVSPEEEGDLRAIERAIGKALPRITLPDFDYRRVVGPALEVPREERVAAIRAQRARARTNAVAKAARSGSSSGGRHAAPRAGTPSDRPHGAGGHPANRPNRPRSYGPAGAGRGRFSGR
jgi:ATP-dependent RNA helicase RhlE